MEEKQKTWIGRFFRFLAAIVVGGAVGSILGLTLAPKRGKETRDYLRERSRHLYFQGRSSLEKRKVGLLKRLVIKLLLPKKKDKNSLL